MKTPDQIAADSRTAIAAELANDLFGTDCAPSELRKINAAIEKATEERDTWWRERTSSERVLRLEKELESRAAIEKATRPKDEALLRIFEWASRNAPYPECKIEGNTLLQDICERGLGYWPPSRAARETEQEAQR